MNSIIPVVMSTFSVPAVTGNGPMRLVYVLLIGWLIALLLAGLIRLFSRPLRLDLTADNKLSSSDRARISGPPCSTGTGT